MAALGSALLTLLAFALLISLVVFVHELGHLWVAHRMGVKALRFSIGFGPRLFGFTWGGTEYQLSALPFGGYVKFAGDNPHEEVAPEDRGKGFLEARPRARAAIAFAGPFANFVLAFAVFFLLSLLPHQQLAPVIGFVKPGSPAAEAGLRARDRIAAVDGQPVRSFLDVQERVREAYGRPVELSVERDGRPVAVRVVPATVEEKNPIETVKQGRVGISASPRRAVVAVLAPDSPAGRSGLRTFDRVTSLEGKPVASYEDLIARLAARLADPAAPAATLAVAGERPLGAPAEPAPGERPAPQRTEPFTAQLALPAGAAAPLSLGQAEAALGLAAADLNLAVVKKGSAAERAGLLRGDRVVEVAGHPVTWWIDDVEPPRRAAGDKPLALVVLREGRRVPIEVVQDLKKAQDDAGVRVQVPELGAQPDFSMLAGDPELVSVRYGLAEAALRAGKDTVGAIRLMALGLARIVTGRISSEAVGGPLMIADVARKAADEGWQVFLATLAMISVNLGLMNLIPLPVLDGFHILSAGIEGVRKRPLSLRFREIANMVGLVLVLGLMLFAIKNDVVRKFFD